MCFNITVSPFNITLDCWSKGFRYVSRDQVHWSRLTHLECNIDNSTVAVNSVEDGGEGWDWDTKLLLVFILLSILFGIFGKWMKRRRGKCLRRREEREAEEEDVEMIETTVYLFMYILLIYLTH